MQANRLPQAIQDLTSRIFSNDPIEYNSAINLYVEPQAHYTSALVRTHGASRIKKLVAFEKLFIRRRVLRRDLKKSGGGVEGWDDSTQTVTLPTLTTYSLPFSLPLVNITFTLPSTLILHLNENEDGEIDVGDDAALHTDDEDVVDDAADDGELKIDGERERRLVVTKWEEKSVLDSVLAKSRLLSSLYTTFLLPIVSTALLILSSTLFFYRTHRLTDGLFRYALDAAAEIFHALEAELARLMGGGDRRQLQSGSMRRSNAYFGTANQTPKPTPAAAAATSQRITETIDDHPTTNDTPAPVSPQRPASSASSSSSRPPSIKSPRAPTFRPSSPSQPTISSSLTHAQGQHVKSRRGGRTEASVDVVTGADELVRVVNGNAAAHE